MMEEAVMKKCIHEENCSITTLCGMYIKINILIKFLIFEYYFSDC